jgi:hypothetical protein
VNDPDRDEAFARAVGGELAGQPIAAVARARPGGNNRVFRLDGATARFALKFYPPQAADRRDRLGTEYGALSFMADQGVACVPRPLAIDRRRHCALYDWIEGTPVRRHGRNEVTRMAEFLLELQGLRDKPAARNVGLASDACPAAADAFAQLDRRLARLKQVAAGHAALDSYLADEFEPRRAAAVAGATARLDAAAIDPNVELAPDLMALSPSDLAFHNVLRAPDGRLVFLDFEYFGWDDPAKSVADGMLHPGAPLGEELAAWFHDRAAPWFAANDPSFSSRLAALLPIHALIWCLIVLNEFLPERWARRRLANGQGDRDRVLAGQLAKARSLLSRVDGFVECHVGS